MNFIDTLASPPILALIAVSTAVGTFRFLQKRHQSKMKRSSKRSKTVINHGQAYPIQILESETPLNDEIKFLFDPKCNIIRAPHLVVELELPQFRQHPSPLLAKDKFKKKFGGQGFIPIESFVYKGAFILGNTQFNIGQDQEFIMYMQAGPRKSLFFKPEETVAAVVTCGGLCPGLNVVVREIVLTLMFQYKAKKIYGIKYGYSGFFSYDWIELDNNVVRDIQNLGGTFLGSSRGGFDSKKIIDSLLQKGVNQLYVLGGDGTHRGIYQLYKQIKQRKLAIAVVGIPKTIDNDVPIIDSSFGFDTSVSQSLRAIESARTEAMSADLGIGLVRLMGRSCGWIAMNATNASRCVDICLLPQFKFNLYGQNGLLQYIVKLIKQRRHMVIVVAQGAGDAIADFKVEGEGGADKSGNKKLGDIGAFLKDTIVGYGKKKDIEITLKYIDPTYMIRSVQANAKDKIMCLQLAEGAVHGAMAGFTGFTVGHINSHLSMIPISEINLLRTSKIKQDNKQYGRMLCQTLQPKFR